MTASWNYHDSLAANKLYTFGDIDPSIMVLICVNIQKFECAAEQGFDQSTDFWHQGYWRRRGLTRTGTVRDGIW